MLHKASNAEHTRSQREGYITVCVERFCADSASDRMETGSLTLTFCWYACDLCHRQTARRRYRGPLSLAWRLLTPV